MIAPARAACVSIAALGVHDASRPFEFGYADLQVGRGQTIADRNLVLLAVTTGAVLVEAGRHRRRLDANYCALYAGYPSITVQPDGVAAHVVWCTGRGHALPGAPGVDDDRLAHDQVPTSEQIETLLGLGSDMATAKSGRVGRLRDAIGVAVLSAFEAQAELRAGSFVPDCVRRVREHIDLSFWEACDLSTLATVAGVTREHLNATFRRHVGVTPMRYLWDIRRRNAVRLVQTTALSLASVADCCGYKSPFHLSREVKKLTGQSPRDLRRAVEAPTPASGEPCLRFD